VFIPKIALAAMLGLVLVGAALAGLSGLGRADESADQVSSIELRKPDVDESPELVDDDDDGGGPSGDGDRTRGNDGTSGGNNTGDGDRTRGNDGTSGGDNTVVAAPAPNPAPAPVAAGGGGSYSGGGDT
jgi:hypothetical protein